MEKLFGDKFEFVHSDFLTNGADLSKLSCVNFVIGNKSSTTYSIIQNYLLENNLVLHVPLIVSDFDISIGLCYSGNYATICSQFLTYRLLESNNADVCCYKLRNFKTFLKTELVYLKDTSTLNYNREFFNAWKDSFIEFNKRDIDMILSQK